MGFLFFFFDLVFSATLRHRRGGTVAAKTRRVFLYSKKISIPVIVNPSVPRAAAGRDIHYPSGEETIYHMLYNCVYDYNIIYDLHTSSFQLRSRRLVFIIKLST